MLFVFVGLNFQWINSNTLRDMKKIIDSVINYNYKYKIKSINNKNSIKNILK